MSDQVVLVGGNQATKPLSEFSMTESAVESDTDGVLTGVGIDDGTNAPSAADATGTKGDVVITDSYIYVCTATDTWKRAALDTWT